MHIGPRQEAIARESNVPLLFGMSREVKVTPARRAGVGKPAYLRIYSTAVTVTALLNADLLPAASTARIVSVTGPGASA
ncbi:hypothetical protein ACQP2T_40380 [Nonomuraea sp. CA-143628]|uniref:hypothetical protein n=1 Tax=Nonomuraea sp. CA-143628 TaxID=3239997 RepID=UPI003D91982F